VKIRPTAQNHQVNNMKASFENHSSAIDTQEQDFINRRGDLIAVSSQPKPAFRLLFEYIPGLHRLFRVRKREDRVVSGTTFYPSDKALDGFANGVIVAIGLVMLFGPMWWLNYVQGSARRFGTTTGFVLLFTTLLSSATVAKPFEVLAATAA
jgi:hypothetical protein